MFIAHSPHESLFGAVDMTSSVNLTSSVNFESLLLALLFLLPLKQCFVMYLIALGKEELDKLNGNEFKEITSGQKLMNEKEKKIKKMKSLYSEKISKINEHLVSLKQKEK